MIRNPNYNYCNKLPPMNMINEFQGTQEEVSAFNFAINQNEFKYARCFRDQIGILCAYLRNKSISVSFGRIGAVFGATRSTVFDQYQNYIRGNAKNGCPSVLNEDEVQQIISFIIMCHTNQDQTISPTFDDIDNFISQYFNKTIKRDTLENIVVNQLRELFSTRAGRPMEIDRLQLKTVDIENNINQLRSIIKDVPTPFVMNLDEMGEQDFADAEIKRVIVPQNYPDSSAPYAINRNGDRSTVLVCINSLGVVGTPLFAVKRCFGDLEVYMHLPMDSLQIIHTKKGYINTRAFENYFKTNLIPAIQQLRDRFNYTGPSIIIMDN